MPSSVTAWLESAREDRCLLAADVTEGFGQLAALCPPEPRNSGIRGLPPGSIWAARCAAYWPNGRSPDLGAGRAGAPGGRPVAWLRPLVVGLDEVTICSPYHPHVPRSGPLRRAFRRAQRQAHSLGLLRSPRGRLDGGALGPPRSRPVPRRRSGARLRLKQPFLHAAVDQQHLGSISLHSDDADRSRADLDALEQVERHAQVVRERCLDHVAVAD
jgi:hypothetical protein